MQEKAKVTLQIVVQDENGEKVTSRLKNVFEKLEAVAERLSKTVSSIFNNIEDGKSVKPLNDALEKTDETAKKAAKSSASIGENDSEKKVRRLKDVFSETEAAARRTAQAASSITDKDVFAKAAQTSKQFLNEMINSGGMRQYQEVLRTFAPELKNLRENLVAGSFNQEDFNRRISSLPPLMQRALKDVSGLGKGINSLSNESERSADGIQSMILKADLLGRAFSFVAEKAKQLAQAGISSALEVEQVVANVSTIKDVNTPKVTSELYRLSTQIPQDAGQIGEGLYEIFSSVEASQQQALNLVELYSKGAVAARTDTETFGAAVSGVLNAYKMDLSEATIVSDVFFNTVKLGVVNGKELANGLGLVTQPAKNLGITFNELGGLIAGVTKEGGQASQNINNLANLLMKLPTTEVSDGLKKMKIEMSQDGEFRPIITVLSELKAKLDQMPPAIKAAQLQELFPDAQARAGLNTVLSQLDFVKNAILENARAAGTTEEAYKKMSGTASAQFQLFYNSVIAFLAQMSALVTQSKTLGTVLGLLGGLFAAMGNHTAIVLTLVGAVGLLFAAIKTGIIWTTAASLASGQLISSVVLLGKVMVGTASLIQGATATTVAATGGWAAVVLIIGAVIAGLYSYLSASKEVKSADESRVAQLTQIIAVTKDDIAFLNDQSKSLKDSVSNRLRYDAILKSVADTDRLTIKNIEDETTKRQALSDVLKQQLGLRQTELNSQAITAAIASTTKLKEALAAEEQLKSLDASRLKVLEDVKNGTKSYTAAVGDGSAVATSASDVLAGLEQRIANVSTTNKEATEIMDKNVGVLAQMAEAANLSGVEFLRQNGILATNEVSQTQLGDKIDKVNEAIKAQKQAALDAGKAMRDYANSIQEVKLAQADVSITNSGISSIGLQIESNLNLAEFNQKDRDETLRQLKPQFDQLRNALRSGAKDADDYAKRLSSLPEIVQKALKVTDKFGQYNPDAKKTSSSTRSPINVQLPNSGDGFVSYRSSQARYGTEQTIANINTIAQNWQQFSSVPLQVGDISKAGGGALAGHDAHGNGAQGDFRLVRKDGKMLPVTWNVPGTNKLNPLYDREATRQQIMVVKETLPSSRILFNDPELIKEGLTQKLKGHDNHYHVNGLGGTAKGGADFKKEFQQSALQKRQEQSRLLTEAAADNRAKEMFDAYQGGGITLDETAISDIISWQQKTAANAGLAVPRAEELRRGLNNNARGVPLDASKGVADVFRPDTKTPLEAAREKYNLDDREGAYLGRQLSLQAEITAAIEDQALGRKEALQNLEIEYRVLSERNLKEEAAISLGKQRNDQYRELQDIEVELDAMRQASADSSFVSERRYLAARREELGLQKSITDLQDDIANSGINDSLKIQEAHLRDIIELRDRELNSVIAANKAQLELANSTKLSNNQVRGKVLSGIASEVGTINDALADGIISAFKKGVDYLDSRLGKLADIPILGDLAKFANRQVMSKVTTSLMDLLLPPEMVKQINYDKNPLLAEVKDTNAILRDIRDGKSKSAPQVFSQISGGISGGGATGSAMSVARILGSLGILSNGGGNGTPVFNPDAGSGLGISGSATGKVGTSGGILANLKNIFSTKDGGLFGKGGIFGEQGFGNNDGTYAAIGAGANILGNFIGGRGGSIISSAGTGLSMGASIGTLIAPGIGTAIGAGVGAVAGAILGIFSGGTRKQDEVARTEAYQAVLAEYDNMILQLKAVPPKLDPLDAQIRTNQMISEYNTQMSQLKDTKTRNIALKEVKDGIIYKKDLEFKAALKIAEANQTSIKKNQGFTGQFAGGGYMDSSFQAQYDEFKRLNGLLPGSYNGRDYIKALVGDGEMILNAAQQMRVISNARAGADNPFVDAGIPRYQPSSQPATFATGASINAPGLTSGNSNRGNTYVFNIDAKGSTMTEEGIKRSVIDATETPEFQKRIKKINDRLKTGMNPS